MPDPRQRLSTIFVFRLSDSKTDVATCRLVAPFEQMGGQALALRHREPVPIGVPFHDIPVVSFSSI
jgi:hypothetical protein